MRVQGQQVRGDMAAFKAANPGACFEDCVRWLSPWDWPQGPSGHRLSERMAPQVWPACSVLCHTTQAVMARQSGSPDNTGLSMSMRRTACGSSCGEMRPACLLVRKILVRLPAYAKTAWQLPPKSLQRRAAATIHAWQQSTRHETSTAHDCRSAAATVGSPARGRARSGLA